MDEREEYRLLMEEIGPVIVLRSDIQGATMHVASAIMLPLSLFPDMEEIYGMPVVRGDRVALLYEARR